jgi:TRAP-type C4-dicarboxylate transport system substrate-binding protein
MAEQKKEAREGLEETMTLVNTLKSIYGMEVVPLSPAAVKAFRDKARPVYTKWSDEIGAELVRSAERIVERAR